jgi:hypothetical protein
MMRLIEGTEIVARVMIIVFEGLLAVRWRSSTLPFESLALDIHDWVVVEALGLFEDG